MSDNIYGLASVNYTDRDGYGYNELTSKEIGDTEDLTFRGKLLFDISDSVEAKLTVDLAEVNHTGAIVELLPETNSPLFIGTTQALYGVPAGSGDDLGWVRRKRWSRRKEGRMNWGSKRGGGGGLQQGKNENFHWC